MKSGFTSTFIEYFIGNLIPFHFENDMSQMSPLTVHKIGQKLPKKNSSLKESRLIYTCFTMNLIGTKHKKKQEKLKFKNQTPNILIPYSSFGDAIPSLKLIAPETLGLVQMSFLLGISGLFSGAFAVSFREGISTHP